MIELILPMPVSTNVYYRNVAGKMLISAHGRAYIKNVHAAVLEQIGLIKPITESIHIEIMLHAPDRRRRDLDNFCGKALLDALAKAKVFVDDSQIDSMIVKRGYRVPGGKVFVKIAEIEEIIAQERDVLIG